MKKDEILKVPKIKLKIARGPKTLPFDEGGVVDYHYVLITNDGPPMK